MKLLVIQSCLTLCDPVNCSLPGSFCPWNSLGTHTGLGCHSHLQGIFLTQGLNLHLLHYRHSLYYLSHQAFTSNLFDSDVIDICHFGDKSC